MRPRPRHHPLEHAVAIDEMMLERRPGVQDRKRDEHVE